MGVARAAEDPALSGIRWQVTDITVRDFDNQTLLPDSIYMRFTSEVFWTNTTPPIGKYVAWCHALVNNSGFPIDWPSGPPACGNSFQISGAMIPPVIVSTFNQYFSPGFTGRVALFTVTADTSSEATSIPITSRFPSIPVSFTVPQEVPGPGTTLPFGPDDHPLASGLVSLGLPVVTGLYVIGILLLVVPISIVFILKRGKVNSQEIMAYTIIGALANVMLQFWHPIVFVFVALFLSWTLVDHLAGGRADR